MAHTARPTAGKHMLRLPAVLLSCLALALLLASCGGNGKADEPRPTGTPKAVASPSAASTPSAPLPAPVANAQQQAASDAGVPVAQVLVLRYERVEFPSAALGCPAPGKGYAQVITPGYSVQLRVGDHDVEYHTNLEQAVVRCLSNSP